MVHNITNCIQNQLTSLGADEILTEDEVRSTQIFKSKKLPAPKLALNCIGGQSAHEVLRHLAQDGIMVTYGGMSREPLTIPISALIFKVIINYLESYTNIAKDKKI